MSDRKRYVKTYQKTDMLKKSPSIKRQPQTFDDVLEMQMNETIASVVRAETYPGEENANRHDDGEFDEYRQPRSDGRFFQDAYTVAQHYIDRVQFRR